LPVIRIILAVNIPIFYIQISSSKSMETSRSWENNWSATKEIPRNVLNNVYKFITFFTIFSKLRWFSSISSYPVSFRSIFNIVLSSRLSLASGIPLLLSLSAFRKEFPQMLSVYSVNVVILCLLTLIPPGEELKLRRCSLCSFLQPPTTSFFLDPQHPSLKPLIFVLLLVWETKIHTLSLSFSVLVRPVNV
jgi:hypothetical protein